MRGFHVYSWLYDVPRKVKLQDAFYTFVTNENCYHRSHYYPYGRRFHLVYCLLTYLVAL